MDSESKNFEKIKIMSRDINFLHIFAINENHIMHGSSDREGDGQNFLSFWTLFSPFTSPVTTQKIKF